MNLSKLLNKCCQLPGTMLLDPTGCLQRPPDPQLVAKPPYKMSCLRPCMCAHASICQLRPPSPKEAPSAATGCDGVKKHKFIDPTP